MRPKSIQFSGILILFAGWFWLGCGEEEDRPSPQLQQIVARWTGGHLNLGECLHTFRELHAVSDLPNRPDELADQLRQYAGEWAAEKILTGRAEETGLDRDPRHLDRLRAVREDRLIQLLIRREVDEQITITDRDIRRYYDEHPDEFMTPAAYTYYRIFFSKKVHGAELAEQRAKEAWKRLEAGANFNDLVEEYSDSDVQRRYELFGPYQPGDNDPRIEQVIMDTPVRRHSVVVETPGGFWIFYPEKKAEAVRLEFSKVTREIHQRLFRQRREVRLEKYLENLAAEYRIITHPELFDEIDVDDGETVLEVTPGNGRFSWGEFEVFAQLREAGSRAEREDAFEQFAKRKLAAHHAAQIDFTASEYFRDRFRPVERRLLSDYLLGVTVDPNADPTDEEILAYYEEHPDEFRRPEQIRAWHILRLIRYPLDGSELDRINAERKTYEELALARKAIMEQGLSFERLAYQFTESEDGGDIGLVPTLSMPPAWVSKVAFLEEGEISLPFRVEDAFEIVLLQDREEGGVLKFENAVEQVEKRVREKKEGELRAAHIQSVLAEAGFQINLPPLFDLINRLRILDRIPPKYWLDPYREI